VILVADDSGVEEAPGAGEVEPGVDGGVGPPELGAGEVEDPETTLICTFWPAEQCPLNPQMKYLVPTAERVMVVLPSLCVEIGFEAEHESKFACVTSSTSCCEGL
jgi:hypothetical protein